MEELWRGISVVDVSLPSGRREASVKGILMWTMHDYLGLEQISGLSTSGHNACPTCGPSLVSERPEFLLKVIYPNYHRFLPPGHSKYKAPTNEKVPLHLTMADWAHI
ncbi:hypothetical protein L7F22_026811 [Adiantum nelumboides]|nr:hypothetical protein [Adiantum nelumboides]